MEILWKEWRQQRGPVVLGICGGIIWPLMEMAGNYATRRVWRTDLSSGIVAAGGAAFAVFLAMATGYADLRQGIDTFWQTRPVRIGRVFLVKLLVAVGLLAGTFAILMVPEILTGIRETSDGPSLAWTVFWTTWPMAVLVFGAGLFFVALIRDMAKAAFVTMWFGLLVYFLPLFFNGLRPLNAIESIFNYYQNEQILSEIRRAFSVEGLSLTQRIQWILSGQYLRVHPDFLVFIGISFGGAAAFTLLAVQAVKQNWRWQPGQKTIVWTLGASAALIFAITLFQVRSDLRPATHRDGQALVNPMPLDWVEPPLPQAVTDRGARLFRSSYSGRVEHGAYLYVLSVAYEADHELSYKEWDRLVYRHLVLHTYRFPVHQDSSPLCCGGLVIGSTTETGSRGIGWPIRGSYIRGHCLYVASLSKVGESKTCVATLDISSPEQPRLIGTIEVPGVGYYGSSFIGHGDHAYVLGSNQWTVLSLGQPDQPVVAAQWTSTSSRGDLPPQLPRHLSELSSSHLPYSLDSVVAGDRLLCTDGSTLVMIDLSEPNDPMLVLYEDLRAAGYERYAQITAMAVEDDHLYLSTGQGLFVRRLVRHADGHWSSERTGYRAATPLERLSGRNVSEIMLCDSHLIESDRDFGLLVYDVSDPTRPRRVMHSDLYSDGIGIWNGLLYSLSYGSKLTLFDLPPRREH